MYLLIWTFFVQIFPNDQDSFEFLPYPSWFSASQAERGKSHLPLKPLKVKSSGAEAHAEGLFLKQQNRSGKVAKVLGERGALRTPFTAPSHPDPSGKKRAANERQLWLSGGGVECGSGQTPLRTRAAPRERGRPGGGAGSACGQGERPGCSPPPGNPTSGHHPPRRYSSHGFHPW